MSQAIDFSKLSLRDTLDLAISIEEEAKERYDDFAEQMEAHRTADTANFFRFMADNEIKHAEKLAAQRNELFRDEPNTADTSVLYDVDAPEFDTARAFMSVRAALDVAMQSEIKAYEFYDNALAEISDAEVRELFLELRDRTGLVWLLGMYAGVNFVLIPLVQGVPWNEMIDELGLEIDVVVPVPDSARHAAHAMATELGLPYREGLVKNRYVGRTFIEPSQEIRDFGVKLKLNPVRHLLAGKRVILVDDSIVRGTTSRKIVRMVSSDGVRDRTHAHRRTRLRICTDSRTAHDAAQGETVFHRAVK